MVPTFFYVVKDILKIFLNIPENNEVNLMMLIKEWLELELLMDNTIGGLGYIQFLLGHHWLLQNMTIVLK